MRPYIIYIATIILLSSCNHSAEYQQNEGRIFGTLYHITYKSNNNLGDSIHSTLQAIDASLSVFNDTSTISLINANLSRKSDYLLDTIFNRSQQIYHITDGAFDPTVSPLINAWGFGFEHIDRVTPTLIDSLKQIVGMNRVTITDSQITKQDALITLNFSAIAKGYACDIIAQLLQSNAITDYLIEIGGEVVASGSSPTGEPWRIGVNTPESDTADIETILYIDNGAIATSGNYRNYYISDDGKRISHTIDPHTGYPSSNNLLSATVIADDCTTADAYATAFMVLGVERSLQLADSLTNIEALLIYSTPENPHTQAHSAGLNRYLR